MSREFGVQYIDYYENGRNCRIDVNVITYVNWNNPARKWHIHPDSLSIFEPMEGDLMVDIAHYSTLGGEYVHADSAHHERFLTIGNAIRMRKEYPDTTPTIQRNNTAFFTPEVDDD